MSLKYYSMAVCYRRPYFPRMKDLLKTPLIFDGRNQYSLPAMQSMGFECVCIGRGEG